MCIICEHEHREEIENALYKMNSQNANKLIDRIAAEYDVAVEDLKRHGIIEDYDEITGVGHGVRGGVEYFKKSALVAEEVIEQVEELSLLAPLHNPGAAAGIRAFHEILPDIVSVVVFDTSFHTTMPRHAYLYPIPHK